MESFYTLNYDPEIDKLEKEIEELKKEMKETEKAIKMAEEKQIPFMTNPEAYIIEGKDFVRNSPKERKYLKAYKFEIFEMFDHRCANCHHAGLLDADHFLVSKDLGGTFYLKTAVGRYKYINNLIPLCEKCNRSKKNKNCKDFCSPQRLSEILKINRLITIKVNQDVENNLFHAS